MDEAALRAMMPMSFGKKSVKKSVKPEASAPAPAAETASGTDETSAAGAHQHRTTAVPADRSEVDRDDDGEQDDGLTPEERRANADAERRRRQRRAQGLDSDSDSDSDSGSSDSDDSIGPPLPSAPRSRDLTLPPLASVAEFRGVHSKTLSALAVDGSGARFALGSYDHSLSLYDFGGMSSSLLPFRTFEPGGSSPVLDLAFSRDAALMLVVNSAAQARLYTRDGAERATCAKGDPYLRDMRHTKGHVAALTCGAFHPTDPARFVTAGEDSTVRMWDVGRMASAQLETIVVKSKARGTRTRVTAIELVDDKLVAASEDGAIAWWDLRGNLRGRPRGVVEGAHEAGQVTSSVAAARDGWRVMTRAGDSTVKLWDLRSFRDPVVTRTELASSMQTSVVFDPYDQRTVLTGSSANGGEVHVLDTTDLTSVHVHPLESPGRMVWAAGTNQLFITSRTSLSVFYSSSSTNGITLPLSRPSRPSQPHSHSIASTSESYEVEVGERELSQAAKRRRLAKTRQDPTKSYLPQAPVSGVGSAGRIGAAQNTHLVQSLYQPPKHEDPREALLKYATQEPKFTNAWSKTQPNPIYHPPDPDIS